MKNIDYVLISKKVTIIMFLLSSNERVSLSWSPPCFYSIPEWTNQTLAPERPSHVFSDSAADVMLEMRGV